MSTRVVLVVALILAMTFLGFAIGQFTVKQSANYAIAKDAPDLKDVPELEKALTMAIIASSHSLAKDMVKYLDKADLTNDAVKTFRKAAQGLGKPNRGRQEADPNKVYDVSVGDSPSKGPDNAPVTIIAFSEFQCPFCGRAEKTMKELEEKYGSKLRFVFKSKLLPMHSKAPQAHAAAYAAGRQGKFWEMHGKIFDNQGAGLTEENYLKYATELGLNMNKFKADMADPKIKDEWADDEAESNKLGVRSTPTFFINGKMVRGAKPIDEFVKVIDEALAAK